MRYGCLTLITTLHCGEQLIRGLGHEAMILLSLLSYVVRTFGYSRLQPSTVWYLLALEPCHGITFAFAWTAAVDKVKAALPAQVADDSPLPAVTCRYL